MHRLHQDKTAIPSKDLATLGTCKDIPARPQKNKEKKEVTLPANTKLQVLQPADSKQFRVQKKYSVDIDSLIAFTHTEISVHLFFVHELRATSLS